MAEHRIVETHDEFAEVIDRLRRQSAYAIDTEFHRERSYYPRVALVQLAWEDEVALVDPLCVSVEGLADVFSEDNTAVLHAAGQDLEVFDRCVGSVPRRIFDTQVAAGFLGMTSPSLASLHDRELGTRLPKADRLTDWMRRPLTSAQLDYAASDVAHLLEIYERVVSQLSERGRLDWALAECEELLNAPRGQRDPELAWKRIKEARHLRGQALSTAQGLAAWRERTAAESDQPVRFVLSDLGLVGIAQHRPPTLQELKRIRGVDERHLRGEQGRQILAVVAETDGLEPRRDRSTKSAELSKDLRPAVSLVSAWVSQLARDNQIDTALLATRTDLEAFLRGDEDARLAHGWRAKLVGEPVRCLVAGEAALAFEGHGSLILEARSRRPLGS